MERLNLNIPKEARVMLRQLARNSDQREAEYARLLLLRAIKDARREDFFRRFRAAQTPAKIKRDLEIARAFWKIRGK